MSRLPSGLLRRVTSDRVLTFFGEYFEARLCGGLGVEVLPVTGDPDGEGR
jgi:hypothetical protein